MKSTRQPPRLLRSFLRSPTPKFQNHLVFMPFYNGFFVVLSFKVVWPRQPRRPRKEPSEYFQRLDFWNQWVPLIIMHCRMCYLLDLYLKICSGQVWNAFFACLLFSLYVGQPDNHIGPVTLMPFPSIYPTDARTNPAQFCKKNIENSQFWKLYSFTKFVLPYCEKNCSSHPGQDWFIIHVKLGHSMDNGFIFKKIDKK